MQGFLRELDRLYWNHNQKHFYDQEEIRECSEWWPGGLRNFEFGNCKFEVLDFDGDLYVKLTVGGREFSIEISGKRIGMYGPGFPMTDYEMVDWFNQSLKDIGA